jgi:hypothetical protein
MNGMKSWLICARRLTCSICSRRHRTSVRISILRSRSSKIMRGAEYPVQLSGRSASPGQASFQAFYSNSMRRSTCFTPPSVEIRSLRRGEGVFAQSASLAVPARSIRTIARAVIGVGRAAGGAALAAAASKKMPSIPRSLAFVCFHLVDFSSVSDIARQVHLGVVSASRIFAAPRHRI